MSEFAKVLNLAVMDSRVSVAFAIHCVVIPEKIVFKSKTVDNGLITESIKHMPVESSTLNLVNSNPEVVYDYNYAQNTISQSIASNL